MRGLKLALLVELELGCVWTLALLAAPSGEAALIGLMLFVPIYLVQLAFMIVGGLYLAKQPDVRALAAAVVSVPVMLLFVPAVLRAMAGGPVDVHPASWLALLALPLGTCLFLPHQVATFLPRWTLRSRAWNVGLVVLLAAMTLPWLGFFVIGPARAAAASPDGQASIPFAPNGGTQLDWLVGAFLFAALSAVVAGFTFLVSYVGLFQRVDRTLQKLRVTQLILSLVILAPSLLGVAIGLGVLAIAMFNPG